MSASRRPAFTSAMGVVHWIHGHAAVMWTSPQPTLATRLAVSNVLVV